MLTEKAEDYARSLGLSYMYLSTDDKVKCQEDTLRELMFMGIHFRGTTLFGIIFFPFPRDF